MKITKTLVMMAVLSAACLAHAKKGDVTSKQFTEMTGNSVILEVGECALNQSVEPVSGMATVSVQLPYVLCQEVRSYDADVTDNGWFSKNTISNQRNLQTGVTVDVKTFERNNIANVIMNSQAKSNVLIEAAQNVLDANSLMRECEMKKKTFEMKARANNPALVTACGGK